jgi:hypothetical protein
MQIPCFIQSSILTPYVWVLSNDLDFSEPNFFTKIQNFRYSKGPNKTCFLIIELQIRKIFHWHYVLTQIWYLEEKPKMGSSKNFCPLWRNYAPWRNKVIWRYWNKSVSWIQIRWIRIRTRILRSHDPYPDLSFAESKSNPDPQQSFVFMRKIWPNLQLQIFFIKHEISEYFSFFRDHVGLPGSLRQLNPDPTWIRLRNTDLNHVSESIW